MKRILMAVGIKQKGKIKKRKTPAIQVLQKDEGGHQINGTIDQLSEC